MAIRTKLSTGQITASPLYAPRLTHNFACASLQKGLCIDEKLTIFMRVNNVYKNKVLVVKSGEKEVARLKKRHLAPSEMERIVLSKKLLNNIDVSTLHLNVQN